MGLPNIVNQIPKAMINAFVLQHKPFTPQIVKNPEAIRYIVVDLFCGAGGTTTGSAKAKDKDGNQIAIVAACVNHDIFIFRIWDFKSHTVNSV